MLLVHVRADEAEGWAECAVEPEPTYGPSSPTPRSSRCATTCSRGPLAGGPTRRAAGASGTRSTRSGATRSARAAVELAVLDAQLRAAGRSLAAWLGATATAVPPGAALGLHDDLDDLLAEADAALAAGAAGCG